MMSATLELPGTEAEEFLNYKCETIDKSALTLPGPDYVDRVMTWTDRPIPVLRNMHAILNTGRLARTGYVSILPVDQGIEHTAGASFASDYEQMAFLGSCEGVKCSDLDISYPPTSSTTHGCSYRRYLACLVIADRAG